MQEKGKRTKEKVAVDGFCLSPFSSPEETMMYLTVLNDTLLWKIGSGLMLCVLAVMIAAPASAAPPDYRSVKLTASEYDCAVAGHGSG